jgi:hypothetical protein
VVNIKYELGIKGTFNSQLLSIRENRTFFFQIFKEYWKLCTKEKEEKKYRCILLRNEIPTGLLICRQEKIKKVEGIFK